MVSVFKGGHIWSVVFKESQWSGCSRGDTFDQLCLRRTNSQGIQGRHIWSAVFMENQWSGCSRWGTCLISLVNRRTIDQGVQGQTCVRGLNLDKHVILHVSGDITDAISFINMELWKLITTWLKQINGKIREKENTYYYMIMMIGARNNWDNSCNPGTTAKRGLRGRASFMLSPTIRFLPPNNLSPPHKNKC